MDVYKLPEFSAHRPSSPLRSAAINLEARFLAEMFTAAGLGQQPSVTGGGVGEEQFASYLALEQAKMIAEKGGIGLAENIFETLKRRG
ncbi:rod-binding protein [Sagittula sp. SSi028]|uniref:rod-binding protein n=1 Tax=Sagittula sp. SSi028 TaxID=3400636 RepID=UPI003AF7537C